MLSRLSVTQKLSLLLLFPVTAAVLALVPFTVERVDSARAGLAALRTARLATAVGHLAQELQQERALSIAFLATGPDRADPVDPASLLAQQRAADQAADAVRSGLDDPALAHGLDQLGDLVPLRARILTHTVTGEAVDAAYHDRVESIVDALNLPGRPDLDPPGLRRLDALDALLRADEDGGQLDSALLLGAAGSPGAADLLRTAAAGQAEQLHRFLDLADPTGRDLLAVVTNGPSAQQEATLAGRLTAADSLSTVDIDTVVSVVVAHSRVRRLVENQVAAAATATADGQAGTSVAAAAGIGTGGLVLLILTVVLSTRVSRAIASPLRRLARAATAVADIAGAELVRVGDSDEAHPPPPRLAAVTVRAQDELGELGAAINRVQATAALMLERQISTQNNVAVMFANIGYRTQTLVARQVELIDDLEQDESDPQTLGKLYRLDHVTARLRRSADSLLVVSGTRDIAVTRPASLTDVIRSATAEIEGFQAIHLGTTVDVLITAELVEDLRLLLAELLENATSFSPPGSAVQVDVSATADGIEVTVADHGIGMSAARLAEENRRIVERPRLDVVPTEFLGLFVVGRLTRRHGLTVSLEPSTPSGVTARVLVPAKQVTRTGRTDPQPIQAVATAGPPSHVDDSFTWFADGRPTPRTPPLALPPAQPAPPPPPQPVVSSSMGQQVPAELWQSSPGATGLRQRVPGQQLRTADLAPATAPGTGRRDPAAEAARLAQYEQGLQRAMNGATPAPGDGGPALPPVRPGGLVRRIPGAQLDPAIRRAPPRRPTAIRHDPDADRASLDAFFDGLDRAEHPLPPRDDSKE